MTYPRSFDAPLSWITISLSKESVSFPITKEPSLTQIDSAVMLISYLLAFYGTNKWPSMIICAAGAGSTSSSMVQLQWTVTFYPATGTFSFGHWDALLHFRVKFYLMQMFQSMMWGFSTVVVFDVPFVLFVVVFYTMTGGFGQSYRQYMALMSTSSYKVVFFPLIQIWTCLMVLLWK